VVDWGGGVFARFTFNILRLTQYFRSAVEATNIKFGACPVGGTVGITALAAKRYMERIS